jgi:hypothetical protein
MAGRAGLNAIAAHLHIPEQGLAQSDQRGLILDNLGTQGLKS